MIPDGLRIYVVFVNWASLIIAPSDDYGYEDQKQRVDDQVLPYKPEANCGEDGKAEPSKHGNGDIPWRIDCLEGSQFVFHRTTPIELLLRLIIALPRFLLE